MQEGYRKCSCYPGYLRPSNKSCQGESLSCFRDVLYHLGYFRNIKSFLKPNFLGQYRTIIDGGRKKTCMSACVDQTFDVAVSSNSFPSRESFNHRKFFCKVVRKVFFNLDLIHQQLNLGKCQGSHAKTNTHLKLLKNVIQIFVLRLSILLTSTVVIRMKYGLLVKFQKMNQEENFLKMTSSGNK